MNTFELRFRDRLFMDHDGEVKTWREAQIWIDGEEFREPWSLDLKALVESSKQSGEYFIFTCQCGEPACANMEEGFHVKHQGDKIVWRLRRPLSKDGFATLADWRANSKVAKYVFDRQQYVEAIANPRQP